MMKQHYRLFNVGPQKSSLGFISAETENTLKEFCERVRLQIGESKGITVFPHRILQNHWGVELIGNIQSVHLLLNITGRFSLPAIDNKVWPARLVIDMADHVDAYWFTIFLSQQLDLPMNTFRLSTNNVDKSVHNEVDNVVQP
ncbi:hypothetical protein [Mannheimia haemolytica]|uniref:hypothetical protein n=1 Tax=Mannheimia haemolytica TaxID=75985 RepID=UPI0001BCFBE1|nr:hypothetical protein [Mannheimia haemolytica]EEY09780.1 hypothetical protein COI_1589 [Mannheimia haemolytica serotype A2 str. OVINE]MDW0618252.1 hypothetical protein [Mannheimia haemolytica]